jgi:hypothetical protein
MLFGQAVNQQGPAVPGPTGPFGASPPAAAQPQAGPFGGGGGPFGGGGFGFGQGGGPKKVFGAAVRPDGGMAARPMQVGAVHVPWEARA